MHIHIYIHTYTHTYIHRRIPGSASLFLMVKLCTDAYINTYIHTYIHRRIPGSESLFLLVKLCTGVCRGDRNEIARWYIPPEEDGSWVLDKSEVLCM
jgi:hypothetical protein